MPGRNHFRLAREQSLILDQKAAIRISVRARIRL
jgi:hypothetical protein